MAKVESRRWWRREVGGGNGGTGVDAAEEVVVVVGGRREVGVEEGCFGRDGADEGRITRDQNLSLEFSATKVNKEKT
ncbi:hypothetical protein AAC387_Pa10g0913 [Persea americana]